MIIQFDGKSYDTDKVSDEQAKRQLQAAKVATSKSSKTQKVFSILIFIILGESSDSSFYEGLYI